MNTTSSSTAGQLAAPRYLTIREVAAQLGVSRVTVWQWCRDGKLPQPVRFGPGAVRFESAALAEFIERIKSNPAPMRRPPGRNRSPAVDATGLIK